MAEIIDLTKILQKKEEEELERLSSKLADLIDDLGITSDFEMYMNSLDSMNDHVYGLPYVYTIYPMPDSQYPKETHVETLGDVTDVLTKITLDLDDMGYTDWANKISEIVGEMFVSGTFKKNQ